MIIVSDHDFLRNDYEKEFVFEGVSYPTAEHAYQASKVDNPDPFNLQEEKQRIAKLSLKDARKYAKSLDIDVYNWDTRKYFVMKSILEVKFNDLDLQKKLIELDGPIKMHSDRDSFWGLDHNTGYGENNLGVILTEIRDKLKFENELLFESNFGRNYVSEIKPVSLPISKVEAKGISAVFEISEKIYEWYNDMPGALSHHPELEKMIENLKIKVDDAKKETPTSKS